MKTNNDKMARWVWILKEAQTREFLDVLDSEFVDAYICEFGAAHKVTFWGANKCRQLGADLSAMAKVGYLRRYRSGLSGGSWQPGFPKWVWCLT